MSFQTLIENHTTFTVDKFVLPDGEGQEVVLLVVSASFEKSGNDELQLAAEQSPLRVADQFHGDPAVSSVLYEADIALTKPRVDVLVHGHAHARVGRQVSSLHVRLAVADITKELCVTGNRQWSRTPVGSKPSSPQPFLTMPLVFERAFGGIDKRHADPARHAAEGRNLSGVGFRGAPSHDALLGSALPNIEYVNSRQNSVSDTPVPAGFGVVARGWAPRIALAGTYDQAWQDDQWPFLPKDFQPLHYQCAPLDQQSDVIQGGEMFELLNLTPEGLWRFRLPSLDIPVHLIYDNRIENVRPRLDTILVDTDTKRVSLTCRLGIRTRRNSGFLREIVVGHVTGAWLRARRFRKRYLGHGHPGNVHYRL